MFKAKFDSQHDDLLALQSEVMVKDAELEIKQIDSEDQQRRTDECVEEMEKYKAELEANNQVVADLQKELEDTINQSRADKAEAEVAKLREETARQHVTSLELDLDESRREVVSLLDRNCDSKSSLSRF